MLLGDANLTQLVLPRPGSRGDFPLTYLVMSRVRSEFPQPQKGR